LRNRRDKIPSVSDTNSKYDQEDHSKKINRQPGRSPYDNRCAGETEIDANRSDSIEASIRNVWQNVGPVVVKEIFRDFG
jgi:hypothetical protein